VGHELNLVAVPRKNCIYFNARQQYSSLLATILLSINIPMVFQPLLTPVLRLDSPSAHSLDEERKDERIFQQSLQLESGILNFSPVWLHNLLIGCCQLLRTVGFLGAAPIQR